MASDTRLALGIDGGSIPGAALWGFNGYVWSTQGPLEDVLYRLVTHKRLGDVGAFAIEAVYVPRDPAKIGGALSTADNAGTVRGALLFSPLPRHVWRQLWRPTSAEWRAHHGFRRKTAEAKEDALAHARAVTGEAGWFRSESRSHEAEAIAIAEAAYHRMLG